jgi:hypothetical protein
VRWLAPQELAFFEETADAYFEDPEPATRKARPEPLGIGIDAVAVGMWTLFALPVAATVAGNIATDVMREERRRGWWRRRRARADDPRDGAPADEAGGAPDNPFAAPGTLRPVAPGALRPADLELLRRIAYDRAVALGLAPDQAQLLADAILGGVVAGRGAGAPGDDGQNGNRPAGEDRSS